MTNPGAVLLINPDWRGIGRQKQPQFKRIWQPLDLAIAAALLEKKGRTISGFFLTIPREEAIKRMLERGRADDTKEVIERRLSNYDNETLPVIEAYEAAGKIKRIEGVGSIEEIHAEIFEAFQDMQ